MVDTHQSLATESYAVDYGLTTSEAHQRLKTMTEFEEFIGRVEAQYPGRYAGGWIQNTPEFSGKIRFTAGEAIPEVEEEASRFPYPFDIEYSGSQAWRASVSRLNASLPAIFKKHQEVVGASLNVQTELAEFEVLQGADSETVRQSLNEAYGPDYRLKTKVDPARDEHKGGLRLESCTSAFTVRNVENNNRRYLTAGHCAPYRQYYKRYDPLDSTFQASTYEGRLFTANADLAWYDPVNHPARPYFYGGVRVGEGTPVFGTGYAAVGSRVCHQGKTTDYSCGDVTDTTYAPSYDNACPTTCNASFVRVYDSYLKSAGGDSGGPWFRDDWIFGVHKGSNIGLNNTGGHAFYTKMTYLPDRFELLTKSVY